MASKNALEEYVSQIGRIFNSMDLENVKLDPLNDPVRSYFLHSQVFDRFGPLSSDNIDEYCRLVRKFHLQANMTEQISLYCLQDRYTMLSYLSQSEILPSHHLIDAIVTTLVDFSAGKQLIETVALLLHCNCLCIQKSCRTLCEKAIVIAEPVETNELITEKLTKMLRECADSPIECLVVARSAWDSVIEQIETFLQQLGTPSADTVLDAMKNKRLGAPPAPIVVETVKIPSVIDPLDTEMAHEACEQGLFDVVIKSVYVSDDTQPPILSIVKSALENVESTSVLVRLLDKVLQKNPHCALFQQEVQKFFNTLTSNMESEAVLRQILRLAIWCPALVIRQTVYHALNSPKVRLFCLKIFTTASSLTRFQPAAIPQVLEALSECMMTAQRNESFWEAVVELYRALQDIENWSDPYDMFRIRRLDDTMFLHNVLLPVVKHAMEQEESSACLGLDLVRLICTQKDVVTSALIDWCIENLSFYCFRSESAQYRDHFLNLMAEMVAHLGTKYNPSKTVTDLRLRLVLQQDVPQFNDQDFLLACTVSSKVAATFDSKLSASPLDLAEFQNAFALLLPSLSNGEFHTLIGLIETHVLQYISWENRLIGEEPFPKCSKLKLLDYLIRSWMLVCDRPLTKAPACIRKLVNLAQGVSQEPVALTHSCQLWCLVISQLEEQPVSCDLVFMVLQSILQQLDSETLDKSLVESIAISVVSSKLDQRRQMILNRAFEN